MYRSDNGNTYLQCHKNWRWVCRADTMQLCYLQQNYSASCQDRLWLDKQAWFVSTQDPTGYSHVFVNGSTFYRLETAPRPGILRAVDAKGVPYVFKVHKADRLLAEWHNMQLLNSLHYPLFHFEAEPGQFQCQGSEHALLVYSQALPLKEATMRGFMHSLLFRQQYLLPLIADLYQLHLLGFVHGDVHGGNILLTSSGLKLIDFESLRPIVDHGKQAATTNLFYQDSWHDAQLIREEELFAYQQRVPDNHQEFRALGRLITRWLLPARTEKAVLFERDRFVTTFEVFRKRNLIAWYELLLDWLFQPAVCADTLIARIEAIENQSDKRERT
ncbi:hypothetical protein [Rheinheimera sp. F8]|uniref:hypothetical protein n=1 Tax=Rheinheimera sp. F8 TaxID=1763998 RepID=UPI0007448AD3|nr:hypothetical protein [Rheinheimera sp. F8]ALZ76713.1 hypothetical protein ATY27_13725 [Rheinheimera sp. F8]